MSCCWNKAFQNVSHSLQSLKLKSLSPTAQLKKRASASGRANTCIILAPGSRVTYAHTRVSKQPGHRGEMPQIKKLWKHSSFRFCCHLAIFLFVLFYKIKMEKLFILIIINDIRIMIYVTIYWRSVSVLLAFYQIVLEVMHFFFKEILFNTFIQ